MDKIFSAGTAVLAVFLHAPLFAQIFTAYDVHFERLPFLKNVNIEYTSRMTIDIVRGRPLIKKLDIIPYYPLADSETKRLLNQLIFVRDTSGFQLTIVVKNNPKLMNQYSEVSGDTIFFVFPWCPLINRCPVGMMDYAYYWDRDSLFCNITAAGFIYVSCYLHSVADIYLERIFSEDSDSTIIIRNNYPEAEKEIIKGAKYYSKNYFESRMKLGLEESQFLTIMRMPDSGKRYFLKCSLCHIYPCNIEVWK